MDSVKNIFSHLGDYVQPKTDGLAVTSPWDGSIIAALHEDDAQSLRVKIERAKTAQVAWAALHHRDRAKRIEAYAAALKADREKLGELIHLEAGKTMKEGLGEADSTADVTLKLMKDSELPELSGMLRRKERPPFGVVGLITSFNFPAVVAHWTISPALLAGNAVVWKPSEKTPLTALACKAIFDKVFGEYKDLLQIAIGLRDIGSALVVSESVDMISATGSVAMGEGIKKTLATKKNNSFAPILELGGNNGIVVSDKTTPEHIAYAAKSILSSFLGTTGQRCTNTRRLIVHTSVYDALVKELKSGIEQFLTNSYGKPDNEFGYGALIDKDAFERFEKAKNAVTSEIGEVLFGKRITNDKPEGYYVEPALALLKKMPGKDSIIFQETFAPILFITPYDGDIDQAMKLVNAPHNAGLVNGIYTLSQKEADRFAALNDAGHSVINSPKGTGTPAFGMGFGGNKDSGTGEILNMADPLQAFTRPGKFTRVAQAKDVTMQD